MISIFLIVYDNRGKNCKLQVIMANTKKQSDSKSTKKVSKNSPEISKKVQTRKITTRRRWTKEEDEKILDYLEQSILLGIPVEVP